jgi:hypothetical protein
LESELASSANFNARYGVSNTGEYITVTGTNEFVDGDYVLYYQDTANAESFNANTGVSNNIITTANTNGLANGDRLQYLVNTGNTVLSGLTYNGKYYVINATSSSIQLSATVSGSPINIASGFTETGHNLYQLLPSIGGLANNSKYYVINSNTSTFQLSTSLGGPAINITSTSIETGHHFATLVPASGNTVFILNISRLT